MGTFFRDIYLTWEIFIYLRCFRIIIGQNDFSIFFKNCHWSQKDTIFRLAIHGTASKPDTDSETYVILTTSLSHRAISRYYVCYHTEKRRFHETGKINSSFYYIIPLPQ